VVLRHPGEFAFEVGDEKFRLKPGDSAFAPRTVPHVWACVSDKPGTLLAAVSPAGTFETFMRALTKLTKPPTPEELEKAFVTHGMKVVGPPLKVECEQAGRAEPAVAADGAGMTASVELKSLRPAPLLNFVVRHRGRRGRQGDGAGSGPLDPPRRRESGDEAQGKLADAGVIRAVEIKGKPTGTQLLLRPATEQERHSSCVFKPNRPLQRTRRPTRLFEGARLSGAAATSLRR
jgi:hypothetical protein